METFAVIANFISLVGFPAFIAYYVLSKYTEERRRGDSLEAVIHKIEKILEKLDYVMNAQCLTLNRLLEKIDKVFERDTIILERLSKGRNVDGGH